jgi:hypothetical protein
MPASGSISAVSLFALVDDVIRYTGTLNLHLCREIGDLELEGMDEWLHVLELSVKWNFEAARKFAIKSRPSFANI